MHGHVVLAISVAISFTACSPVEKSYTPEFTHLQVLMEASGMPNLTTSENGTVFLSWIGFVSDTMDALYFSELEADGWSVPHMISSGSDWFVNWADFPSFAVFRGGKNNLAAHWLQKSAAGIYDYDVRIAISNDGGRSWPRLFTPHTDSVHAEHGFVSFVPLNDGRMFVTWLDGRKMSGHDHLGSGGDMTLRAATFDTEGRLDDEWELDPRVCECCQTTATGTRKGVVVIYRDRDISEVRDIAIVRHENNKWTAPQIIYQDDWQISGCPVNGPAADAIGDTLAIAWYSAPDDESQVKVIFSCDGGSTFGTPVRIDHGSPLGRVGLVMRSQEQVLVSWMEAAGDSAQIRAVAITLSGRVGDDIAIATTTASRQSGFPVMTSSGGRVVFAWTAVEGEKSVVRTAVWE